MIGQPSTTYTTANILTTVSTTTFLRIGLPVPSTCAILGSREKTPSLTPYLLFVTDTTDGVCVKKLPGVNFYRFNAKNWQFTVYFAVITQKIGNLLCILS